MVAVTVVVMTTTTIRMIVSRNPVSCGVTRSWIATMDYTAV